MNMAVDFGGRDCDIIHYNHNDKQGNHYRELVASVSSQGWF